MAERLCSCAGMTTRANVRDYENKCPNCNKPMVDILSYDKILAQPDSKNTDEHIYSDIDEDNIYDTPKNETIKENQDKNKLTIKIDDTGIVKSLMQTTLLSPNKQPFSPRNECIEIPPAQQSTTNKTTSPLLQKGKYTQPFVKNHFNNQEDCFTNRRPADVIRSRPILHRMDLPKFKGRPEDPKHYFLKLTTFLNAHNIVDSNDIISIFLESLEGEALELYLTLDEYKQANLDSLMNIFNIHFRPRKHEIIGLADLLQTKKQSEETISEFHLRLRQKSGDIGGVDNNMTKAVFIQGLPTNYQKHIAFKRAHTADQVYEAALEYEEISGLDCRQKYPNTDDNREMEEMKKKIDSLSQNRRNIHSLENQRAPLQWNNRQSDRFQNNFTPRQSNGFRSKYPQRKFQNSYYRGQIMGTVIISHKGNTAGHKITIIKHRIDIQTT